MKKGPKIVVIGAGSYFFGRPVIWNMVTSEVLKRGTLALVDSNPEVLKTMKTIAEKAIAETKAPVKLEASTKREDLMKDADFVVLTFSRDNTLYRGIDTRISAKYGVTMCSSDTIGPGGIFRALREIPVVMDIAADMRKLCPDAWLVSFVNPTAVLGIALMRYASDIKSFALCDGNHEPGNTMHFLKSVGLVEKDRKSLTAEELKKTQISISGVNHCTWMYEFTYDGKDMLPAFRDNLSRLVADELPNMKAKPRLNYHYALELMNIYGAYPTAVSHTKEYVPFFQGYGASQVNPEPIILFDAENRAEEMKTDWHLNEEFASGKRTIAEFIRDGKKDHATDIIQNMWGNLKGQYYINTSNRGAVPNMPDDAFLELKCNCDMNGIRPLKVPAMPRGLLGLQHQVLDTHELTAEAAVSCDRKTLLKAMVTDPIINNITDAKNIMSELLYLEKEALPSAWNK